MRYQPSLLLPFVLGLAVRECAAKSIPANVAALKASIASAGKCAKPLKTGFYASDSGPDTWSYCGDHVDQGIIYVSGAGGKLVDMDVDCDGQQNGAGDDGRCGSSSDTQSETSFKDTVAGYKKGIKDLNAYVHPYVVFGNVGSKAGYATFDPTKNGIKPLSLMAVVCGDQMYYGIFGDTNGDDGPKAVVGEASISMATLCFGKDKINGNAGHDATDVLVLAFTGEDTVPGAEGADWAAKSAADFIAFPAFDKMGDTLVAKIGGGSGGSANETSVAPDKATGGEATPTTLVKSAKPATKTGESSSSGSESKTESCPWAGHCAGATCSTSSDCSGELECKAKKCAAV